MSGTPDYLNLIWSKVEHKLGDFVSKFPLPQIVRVEEGYYGPSEDSCLGSEQILTLHAVRSTEKVRAKDHRNRDLHIPLNCSQRVELRPQNLKELYEHVSELSSVFPRFVRVVQGYYNLENEDQCISPGDKLELKKIKRGDVEDYLEFENQERIKVRLPMSVSAGFQPLVDGARILPEGTCQFHENACAVSVCRLSDGHPRCFKCFQLDTWRVEVLGGVQR